MTAPRSSIIHSTFTIEREYPVPPATVFHAFANEQAKARWFKGPEGWWQGERSLDFRVGGRETDVGGPPGGFVSRFESVYHDIVPDERIVYSYDMTIDGTRISVSLSTVELLPTDGGTRLVLTEQGAYFADADGPEGREEGTREILEQLATALAEDDPA